ncbi:membrane protein [Beggiatoa sp. PS]|nr:membrane protein [Beggiatoa sp. PS]
MLAFLLGIALYFIVHHFFLKESNNLLYGKKYFQKIMILVSISLVIFILLSLWRYQIFGQIFPQPVYAKASNLNIDKLISGFHYFFDHYWLPSLIILTSLLLFVIYDVLFNHQNNINKNIALMTVIAFIGATLAFSVTSGGDWMEGGRFFVPILPLLVISGLYAVTKIPKKTVAQIVLGFIALVATMDTISFMSESSWDKAPESIPLPLAKAAYSPILQDFQLSESDFPWFELISREYLSHLPGRVMLDTIIDRLLTAQQAPLTLLSIQMGMISFYLTSKHFGKVKFIDMRALTTKHFTQCNLTQHLPKSKFGIELSYKYFWSEFDNILSNCLIKKPEIIFEQAARKQFKLAEQNGYKAVYFHLGWIKTGSCWVRKKRWTGFYIAVREDLLDIVGDLGQHAYKKWPDFYQWPEVKCQIEP